LWRETDWPEVVATNAFGNVIVRATDGAFWRICPEEWSCEQVARNEDEGRCYCLKQPAVIGGTYEAANLGTISLHELISFSGAMAQQIKDVPDGGPIQIEIVP
jgi:hypothetical protein